MPVYHCFACPLIFQSRNEVEWHLRNDHRSAEDEKLAWKREIDAARRPLDWDRLLSLQSAISNPSVTLLMPTTPAKEMITLDVARLRYLATRASRRLRDEMWGQRLATLESRVERIVTAAAAGPTDVGLVVLVSEHDMAIVGLPFPPAERAVVDPTFATRDLVAALQRFPRFRVVVLSAEPRLFEGHGRQLNEIPAWRGDGDVRSSFPHPLRGKGRADRPTVASRPDRRRRQRVMRAAEEALDRRCGEGGDLPLMIVGSSRALKEFRERSRHAKSVISEIRGSFRRVPVARLAAATETAQEGWRTKTSSAAIDDLTVADDAGSIVWGLDGAWHAACHGTVNHLWVDSDYAVPARVGDDGRTFAPAVDREDPNVNDDIVDEIIEMTIALGKPVSMIDHLAGPDQAGSIAVQTCPQPLGQRGEASGPSNRLPDAGFGLPPSATTTVIATVTSEELENERRVDGSHLVVVGMRDRPGVAGHP